ncbi:response regulator transcription factor [Desulfosporosinus sp. OT]|uniref:response regulator transcription factor n=1 Tax=Desulfosporosinus sp. OT TaxID=913865 RepID=UPI0002239C4D|nr:response regulator transcription factor [Desulfosporosinus sp. OT]EGW41485.1 response regulator [Desulfosporosinus sp. OT]
MKKIKILIVDDQPIVCEGLNTIFQFEEDFEVVGVCHNGQEALDFCERNITDIVLMDARMPVMNGIQATEKITLLFPDTKVLILTTFNEEMLIFEGLQNGARGFLLKDIHPEELYKIIRVVHDGGVCLHPDVTQKVLARISDQDKKATVDNPPERNHSRLTNREEEVLRLIGKGFSNIEISSALFIVQGTVKNHVSSLLAKLGARDRTQLAILAQKTYDLR